MPSIRTEHTLLVVPIVVVPIIVKLATNVLTARIPRGSLSATSVVDAEGTRLNENFRFRELLYFMFYYKCNKFPSVKSLSLY